MTSGTFDIDHVQGSTTDAHVRYSDDSGYDATVQVPIAELPALIAAASTFLREAGGTGKADAEMGDFIASNGLRVSQDAVGGIGVTWSAPQNAGWTFHDAQEADALREYFFSHLLTEGMFRALARKLFGSSLAEWVMGDVRSAFLAALAVPASEVETAVTHLDPSPFYRPGRSENVRTATDEARRQGGPWAFAPRPWFEQSLEAYGFTLTKCDSNRRHYSHIPSVDGQPSHELCEGSIEK